jgi:hypothetical protein
MYALWIIGPLVEGLYGPRRFVFIYLVCVAAGSAASFATSANPGVGASGGVFGLFGALLVADRVHKPAMTRNARNLTMQIGLLIGINLLIGFSVPNIDNAAHIGGLVAGAALGFLLVPLGARLDTFWSRPGEGPVSPTESAPDPAAHTRSLRLAGVAGLIVAIALVVFVSPVTYEPPFWWRVSGEPVTVAEAIGDAVAVSPGEAGMVGGQLVLGRGGSQGQLDDAGAAWLGVGTGVTQEEAQPRGHAPGEVQAAVDRPLGQGVLAPERIAA